MTEEQLDQVEVSVYCTVYTLHGFMEEEDASWTLRNAFVGIRQQYKSKYCIEIWRKLFERKSLGLIDCSVIYDAGETQFVMTFLATHEYQVELWKRNKICIICPENMPCFGYGDEKCSKKFNELVAKLNQDAIQKGWQVVEYVGTLLQIVDVENAKHQSLFRDNPSILTNFELQLQNPLFRAGFEMQLSLLYITLTRTRTTKICNPYPIHWLDTENVHTLIQSVEMVPVLDTMWSKRLQADSAKLLTWLSSMHTNLWLKSVQTTNDIHGTHAIFEIQGGTKSKHFHNLGEPRKVMRVYHGTQAQNLHSILHNGLKSMSGMDLEKNGAIFGEGIYFSDAMEVAREFSLMNNRGISLWRHQTLFRDVCSRGHVSASFVLECEVIIDNSQSVHIIGDNRKGKYVIVKDISKLRIDKLHVSMVSQSTQSLWVFIAFFCGVCVLLLLYRMYI